MIDLAPKPAPLPLLLNPEALEALYQALPGRVCTLTDPAYENARAGYSLTDLPSPEVVVVAENVDDVMAAVNFAREHDLPVGVHATGHNFGFAYQGGVMVNTSRLNGVQVDPATRTVRVEGGARWKDVLPKAQAYSLVPLSGSSPEVGVVGYTLFGGIGWLVRKFGAAVDSVVAAEIVTADGQLRRVDKAHEPELFWALCGGGGNFGIVTALELKLYPVDTVYGGNLFFPMARAKEVLSAYRDWLDGVPDEMTSAVVMLHLPPIPELPPFLRGQKVIAVRACYLGAAEDGAKLLEPLRTLGGLIADTFRQLPYADSGEIANDPVHPSHSWRKHLMLERFDAGLIDALQERFGESSDSALTVIEIRHLGGALNSASSATSFSQRHAPFVLHAIGSLITPAQAEAVKHDAAALVTALQPFATGGVLPGWLGDGDAGVHRTRAGYTPKNWDRLEAIKLRYDPHNRFRHMHNIPPKS